MAVIAGLSCRFPGGIHGPEELWTALEQRRVVVSPNLPAGRDFDFSWDAEGQFANSKTMSGAFIENYEDFDFSFFKMSPKEAGNLDPQQRWALEVAYEAICDARLSPADLASGSNYLTGVFVGSCTWDHLITSSRRPHLIGPHTTTGYYGSNIANRISYVFDLKGPSMTINTACSSSLTALTVALQSLRTGQCNAALVLGVNYIGVETHFVGFAQAKAISPTGTSRPFDAAADGYVRAEGCGAVLLLGGDRVEHPLGRAYAHVLACRANEDGKSVSMTAPSEEAQEELVAATLAEAGVTLDEVAYVEAHGTGTKRGDPIECNALAAAFAGRKEPLPIGSVKGNLGHMEFAAGIAGLIKAALMLHKGRLLPHVGMQTTNPLIAPLVEEKKIRIVTESEDLRTSDRPLYMGVNSFGIGGGNAHAVLKGTQRAPLPHKGVINDELVLALPLSAHSRPALEATLATWQTRLARAAPADVASLVRMQGALSSSKTYSNQSRYLAFKAGTASELTRGINAKDVKEPPKQPPRVALVFGGQGSQHTHMCVALYRAYPAFREALDRCDVAMQAAGGPKLLEDVGLCSETGLDDVALQDVASSLPCIVATQVALVTLLGACGIVPVAVLGHSAGELVAAWAAGRLSLKGLCQLTIARARAQKAMPEGAMSALGASAADATKWIEGLGLQAELSVAAINSSTHVTISGSQAAIEAFGNWAAAHKISFQKLLVQRPFHTRLADSVKASFLSELSNLDETAPGSACQFFSSARGAKVPESQGLDKEFWWETIRQPVRFALALSELKTCCEVVVEVSPHRVLFSYVAQELSASLPLACLHKQKDECRHFLGVLGELFCRGRHVTWTAVQAPNAATDTSLTLPLPCWNHVSPCPITALQGDATPRSLVAKATRDDAHDVSSHGLDVRTASLESEKPSPFNVTIRFTEERDGYIRDHVVNGRVVVPGTALLACFFVGLKPGRLEGGKLQARGVQFEKFVAWRAELALELSPLQEGCVALKLNDVVHARVASLEAPMAMEKPLASWQEVEELKRTPALVPTDMLYKYKNLYATSGVKYGPHFQLLRRLLRSNSDDLVFAEIAPSIDSDLTRLSTGRLFHPAVLDACLQGLLDGLAGIYGEAIVPVGVESFTVDGTGFPRQALYVVGRLRTRTPLSFTIDADIWTSGGSQVTAFRGLEARIIFSSPPKSLSLMTIKWQPPVLAAQNTAGLISVKAAAALLSSRSSSSQLIRMLITNVDLARSFKSAMDGLSWEGLHCVVLTSSKMLPHPSMIGLGNREHFLKGTFAVVCSESDEEGKAWGAPGGVICSKGGVNRVPSAEVGNPVNQQLSWFFRDGDTMDHRGAFRTLLELLPPPVSDLSSACVVLSSSPDMVAAASALGDFRSGQIIVYWLDSLNQATIDTASMVGWVRSCRIERRDLTLLLVEAPFDDASCAPGLASLLLSPPRGELEWRYPGGGNPEPLARWLVPRLTEATPLTVEGPKPGRLTDFRVQADVPGQLQSLAFHPSDAATRALADDEVRLKVHAVGLQFRDVMLALGMLPGYQPVLGCEVSGVVLEAGPAAERLLQEDTDGPVIGQRAIHVTSKMSDTKRNQSSCLFASTVVCSASEVALVPGNVSTGMDELAGFAFVMMTAYLGLIKAARVGPEDIVLIHSTAGGVGQAALQLAQLVGAKVIASAGTPEKRAALAQEDGIIAVLDSHDPACFVEGVRSVTNGAMATVVLNSLAGDGMLKSLECLAEGGRFVEIGKRDFLQRKSLPLALLLENVQFLSVHLDILFHRHPERMRPLMKDVLSLLAASKVQPSATTIYPITEILHAFNLMARGKHFGKLVLSVPEGCDLPLHLLSPRATSSRTLFRANATYLFTGATRGVGFALACWAIQNGARHLALGGRPGGGSKLPRSSALLLEHLEAEHGPLHVEVANVDWADRDACVAFFSNVRLPVMGLFHCAAEYDAGWAHEVTADAAERSLRAKARGGLQLHECCPPDLDHFVVFSSITATLGRSLQAAYAGANTFLESLARHRRSLGLPAVCFGLPAVLGAGYLSNPENVRALISVVRSASRGVSMNHILTALDKVLQRPELYPPAVTLFDMKWETLGQHVPKTLLHEHLVTSAASKAAPEGTGSKPTRPSFVRAQKASPPELLPLVVAKLGDLLGGALASNDVDRPLTDLGIDSLAAVELESWAREGFCSELRQEAFLSGMTAQALASRLLAAPRRPQKSDALDRSFTSFDVTAETEVARCDSTFVEGPVAEVENESDTDRPSALAAVASKLSSILGIEQASIDADAELRDLGLDSLAAVELESWSREEFGAEVRQDQLLSGLTVLALSQKLGGKVAKKDQPDVAPLKKLPRHLEKPAEERQDVPQSVQVKASSSLLTAPTVGHTVLVPESLSLESVGALLEKTRKADRTQPLVIQSSPQTPNFCSGLGVLNGARVGNLQACVEELVEELLSFPQPVVVVAKGATRGAGMLFPCVADCVIAEPDATFSFLEAQHKLSQSIVLAVAKRRLTEGRFRFLVLTGVVLDASSAQTYGLVDLLGSNTANTAALLDRTLKHLVTSSHSKESAANESPFSSRPSRPSTADPPEYIKEPLDNKKDGFAMGPLPTSLRAQNVYFAETMNITQ